MKFIVSRNEIFPKLQLVSKVIPSKSTYPMMDNFKFELKGDTLTIMGTDLQTTIISHLPIERSEGEGSIAIEARRLLDILKEFTDQPLTFEINDENNNVTIYTGTGKYSIGAYDTEEYPEPAEIDENEARSLNITGPALFRAINKTIFSTSNDDMQLVMTGILFELNTDNITFVASDGHKLVRYRRYDFQAPEESQFILPKKPAELLKTIVSKYDGDVKISYTSRNALFQLDDYTIICRLIDGQFPNYEAVIPTDNPNKLIIDRIQFLNAIRRVSVFANEASKLVKFDIKESEVIISAQDIDFSISAEETLPGHYEGEPMKIGFKSTFIQEILGNMDSDEVRMEMSEPSRAALFIPTEKIEEEEDELMLLMPMMLDEE